MLPLSARLLHGGEFNPLSFITSLQNVNVVLLTYKQSLVVRDFAQLPGK